MTKPWQPAVPWRVRYEQRGDLFYPCSRYADVDDNPTLIAMRERAERGWTG